mgnify:CR=1 FL=1
MVRLRVGVRQKLIKPYLHFNSSMVRLRAIRPYPECAANAISIPVWCDWEGDTTEIVRTIETHFNSSMVRLRAVETQDGTYNTVLFQFQYGAIERLWLSGNCFAFGVISIPVWCDWELFRNFTVRASCNISIPVWCDWELFSFKLHLIREIYFNSSMVRLRAQSKLAI